MVPADRTRPLAPPPTPGPAGVGVYGHGTAGHPTSASGSGRGARVAAPTQVAVFSGQRPRERPGRAALLTGEPRFRSTVPAVRAIGAGRSIAAGAVGESLVNRRRRVLVARLDNAGD